MTSTARRSGKHWPRLLRLGALLVFLILSGSLQRPAQAAPPGEGPAQAGNVVSSVDDDPDNQLWDCAARRVPYGNEDMDRLRCFSFRYPVPAGGITSALLHVAIKPLGGLQDTDSLVVAIGEPYPECAWATGAMPGCATLHGGFQGPETSLDLNLLDVACDPSVQGSPQAQQALLRQLQTGVLHFMLQDDTAVLGAQLVLNVAPATFTCGASTRAWVPPAAPSAGQSAPVVQSLRALSGEITRLVTGSAAPPPPSPPAVAAAAAAGATSLAAYALLNAAASRSAAVRPPAGAGATPGKATSGAAAQGSARAASDSTAAQGERTNPATATGAEQEPDLRDALGQFKEQLEGFVEPESEAAARLVVVQGRASQPVVALSFAPVTLGRDPSNTVAIYDALASRRHASVNREGGAWVIADLRSANGTFVNGQPVSKQALRSGDQIRIGQSVLAFQGGAPAGWKCGQCGRANPAHDRFCGNCGTPRPQGG